MGEYCMIDLMNNCHKIRQCGHFVCEDCKIQASDWNQSTFRNQNDQVECLVCTFEVNQRLTCAKAEGRSDTACDICKDIILQGKIEKCQECSTVLCLSCKTRHSGIEAFQGHTIIPLLVIPSCKIHCAHPVMYKCLSCNVDACCVCILQNHSNSDAHSTMVHPSQLTNTFSDIEAALQCFLKNAEKRKGLLKEQNCKITAHLHETGSVLEEACKRTTDPDIIGMTSEMLERIRSEKCNKIKQIGRLEECLAYFVGVGKQLYSKLTNKQKEFATTSDSILFAVKLLLSIGNRFDLPDFLAHFPVESQTEIERNTTAKKGIFPDYDSERVSHKRGILRMMQQNKVNIPVPDVRKYENHVTSSPHRHLRRALTPQNEATLDRQSQVFQKQNFHSLDDSLRQPLPLNPEVKVTTYFSNVKSSSTPLKPHKGKEQQSCRQTIRSSISEIPELSSGFDENYSEVSLGVSQDFDCEYTNNLHTFESESFICKVCEMQSNCKLVEKAVQTKESGITCIQLSKDSKQIRTDSALPEHPPSVSMVSTKNPQGNLNGKQLLRSVSLPVKNKETKDRSVIKRHQSETASPKSPTPTLKNEKEKTSPMRITRSQSVGGFMLLNVVGSLSKANSEKDKSRDDKRRGKVVNGYFSIYD